MCEYLQSITISESVTSVPYRSIFGCAKLTDINVAAENNAYCSVDGVLFSKDKKTLTLYPKGKADTEYAIPKGVVNIEQAAFEWCANLESITIPSGVKEIRYQSFVRCDNLEEIRLPASVESIGDMAFAWCEKLTDVYYGGSEADKASISIEEDSDELLSATWHYSCVDPIEYSFAQSVQIGLIEPWFLKANARVYTDENLINIDYSTLIDYGAYFIRASELENVNAAPETLTAEDIINDADSIKCSKKSGTATVDGSYITASYDKGLYTYEMGDSIFVLFYIEDENAVEELMGLFSGLCSILIGAAVKLGASWLLTGQPEVGMLGIPLSTVLCYAAMAVCNLYFVLRVTRAQLPLGVMLCKPGLAAVFCALTARAAYGMLLQYLPAQLCTLVSIAAGGAVYLAALIALGGIGADVLSLLPHGKRKPPISITQ